MRLIRKAVAPAAKRKATPQFTWEDFAIATLPVLACFLGGATEKWAEGIVFGLLGLLLMLNPPRFSLGPLMHGILLALLGCAALAFLPAHWFFQPAWRAALVNDFGMKIAASVTPQPWITFGCFLSFLGGLSWLYYVCGQEVEIRAARRQLRIFAVFVILLAALAIVLHHMHSSLPFWHNQRGFGPFPNRNQTANFLGLTAVLILACGHDSIRKHKKGWLVWLAGLAVIVSAIVLNFSRAGIAILLIGCGVWLAALVLRTGSKGRIAVGASALLILLTVLLVFGGQTLERFNLRGDTTAGLTSDFRWLIFQDALNLVRASPWCGIGLGNFEPVFAIFRDASIGQNRALHPESDWLWLGAELGWPTIILIVAGIAILGWRCFPFVEGTNQWFRIAALIAALLFAVHGFVDVGGHRVGTAFSGIFLFGMALRRPLPRPASVFLLSLFRIVGLVLFIIGATWLIATYRELPLPGGVGLDVERHLATTSNVGRQSNATITHAGRGLELAPLDWQLYFLRALGEVGAKRPIGEALDDFRRARFLEPNAFEVPYQEGVAWLTQEPLLAITAWREALRRAGPQRAELYDRMLSSASINPVVRQMLEDFGSVQPDLALTYLERSSGEQFASALSGLLQHDPTLQSITPEQRTRFFQLWAERGNLAELNRLLEEQPQWLGAAWRGAAKYRASRRDFRGALELAKRFGDRPKLPEATKGSTIEQLQQAVHASANNYEAGFALYQQQMQENKIEDALVTVRRFTGQKDVPPYFHFLESEAWAGKQDWERAWNARRAYDAK